MDFLLDDTYSPQIANGDFVTGDELGQQQKLLLISNPGDWKESPFTGVGITEWINDENINGLKKEIKRQFKADGLQVNSLTISNGEINIDAARN